MDAEQFRTAGYAAVDQSMLGELYSAAFNAPAFNWICSPAVTELETIVLDWMADLCGLPGCYKSISEGGGVIQGSASEAVVTVMIAARDRYLRNATKHISDEKEREDAFYARRTRLVALGSAMAHSSTQKAAQIAGVRFRAVPAPAEEGYRMTGSTLKETVEQCLVEELEPFYLTATLGTTSTCAIDDFPSLAATLPSLPLSHPLWTHIDAAYAGVALILPEYQHHATHFATFDSFNTNMHKWLLTNFDASLLYVRARKPLIDALSITPAYLRNARSDSGLVTDYRDWQIPLGRRFRSLKIWFVLRTYGVHGLREYLRNHIVLGERFAGWVSGREDLFTVVSGPAFALTVLRVNAPIPASTAAVGTKSVTETRDEPGTADEVIGKEVEEDVGKRGNEVTREVYERINAGGKVMLTSTVVGERYVIRIVSGNPQTDLEHLRKAFNVLVATAEEVRVKMLEGANGHVSG
ncbi:MAG: hypothetical protein LQ351_002263 [Letrouitia transgressa]|nr:MAG: hypothetical protein LQ351_002263 [Letrouitia transgressa]